MVTNGEKFWKKYQVNKNAAFLVLFPYVEIIKIKFKLNLYLINNFVKLLNIIQKNIQT